MFGLFKKDPIKKLQVQYEQKLEEAMFVQRNGDMRKYAALTEEAEAIKKSLDELKEESQSK